ncbi:hypothetical protein K435DRAFT_813216 [Dendrothele bispora CBS 962.96]|uniref:Uncharacterized protein n=1 Tax=Dendrothele bispora (strain CBS 962.96) TaxID=1314807 RepID=A0A4S8KM09_DENBC|nr:hypothetical protein K435DRAFT_813216 [Dendrothele bispora CBS 962.96]
MYGSHSVTMDRGAFPDATTLKMVKMSMKSPNTAIMKDYAWEHWNGVLDTLIQKRRTETMEAYRSRLVKRGPKGTEALYRVLAHVMEKVVAAPDMLDGKIGRLTDAIRKNSSPTKRPLETTIDDDTKPSWVTRMEKFLLPDIQGTLWKDAVEALVHLESTYGYETSNRCLSKNDRPRLLEAWLKSKRKAICPGPMEEMSVDDMESDTVVWWNSIQPEWRTLPWDGPELKDGQWNPINSLYSVLACMWWWLILEQEEEMDSDMVSWNWKKVLSDIVWVIKTMAASEPNEKPVSKKPRTG